MNRKDSRYVESSPSKAPKEEPLPAQKNNTTATRHRIPKEAAATSILSSQPRGMDLQRPASEKRSRPSKQKSTTSSFENAASRSKGRGHGSKHSSHRTSCTIVDPSK